MQEQKFQVEPNFTVILFFIVYFVMGAAYPMIRGQYTPMESILVIGAGIILSVAFYGFRPCEYRVDRKVLTIHYHIRPDHEISLMDCETVCDPVPKFTSIFRRARAIELYDMQRKRYPFFPKERVKFVEAIVRGNKRIHCTVKEYTDVHRGVGRKLRKERRKAEREARRANFEIEEQVNEGNE